MLHLPSSMAIVVNALIEKPLMLNAIDVSHFDAAFKIDGVVRHTHRRQRYWLSGLNVHHRSVDVRYNQKKSSSQREEIAAVKRTHPRPEIETAAKGAIDQHGSLRRAARRRDRPLRDRGGIIFPTETPSAPMHPRS
jgi:hypothetical protein